MRTRLVILVWVVAAAALVAGGIASGQPNAPAPARAPARAAGNARAARRDVRTLLAKVALPPGATVVGRDPAPDGRLSSPGSEPGSTALVDVHEFVRVAGDPGDAIAWFTAHPPTGSTADGTGSGGGPGYQFDSVSYAFAAIDNALVSRGVVVETTEAKGGGTAVRIDAQDVYFVPRPKWERVPAGVDLIDVTVQRMNPSSTSSYTVSDRVKVAKVVSLVNALPPWQPGFRSCPKDVGPAVTLTFLANAGNTDPLAKVVADGSGCGVVSVVLSDRKAPPLSNGDEVVSHIQHLLGIS
jgi:hypothetical protein